MKIPNGLIYNVDTNVNTFRPLPKYVWGEDINEYYVHHSLPCTDIRLLNETPKNYFAGNYFTETLQKVKDGLYKFVDGNKYYTFSNCNVTIGDVADAIDRKESTACQITLTDAEYNTKYSWAKYFLGFTFKLPIEPTDMAYDDAYLVMRLDTKVRPRAFNLLAGANTSVIIASRRFMAYITDILSYSIYGEKYNDIDNEDGGSGRIDTLPDNYFIFPRNQNEYYYYVMPTMESTPAGDRYRLLKNRTILKITDNYSSIYKIAVMFFRNLANGGESNNPKDFVDFIRIYELGVVFEKKITLQDKIYTLLKGRIFNSTWGGRVTAANLIESPLDIYEALCRMQDWSERAAMPSGGWGRAYCDYALIKTSGDGSFDTTELDELDDYSAAAQITDTNDGSTDFLRNRLAREFGFLGYIDNNGYECVKKIPATEDDLETPTDIITFADIQLADSKITIIEPDPAHIYAEPFVRYNKNMATGEYESIIRVHNVTAAAFNDSSREDSGWVESPAGIFTGGEAKALWDECTNLYKICSIINNPPAEITDLFWANGGDHAHEIAKRYITRLVYWMRLKRCTFKVHFACTAGGGMSVRDWMEGHRFILKLPHETDNVEIECIASKIVIDTNKPYYIEVSAYMLETEKLPEDFYWKDTMDITAPNIKDTMNADEENIKDSM